MTLPPVINVPCSTELLEDMEDRWSRPVQVKAIRLEDGTYELVMREPEYGIDREEQK